MTTDGQASLKRRKSLISWPGAILKIFIPHPKKKQVLLTDLKCQTWLKLLNTFVCTVKPYVYVLNLHICKVLHDIFLIWQCATLNLWPRRHLALISASSKPEHQRYLEVCFFGLMKISSSLSQHWHSSSDTFSLTVWATHAASSRPSTPKGNSCDAPTC